MGSATGPDNIPSIKTTPPIDKETFATGQQPNQSFGSYMKGTAPNPLLQGGQSPQISPFDLAKGNVPPPGPTLQSVQDQTKQATQALGDLNNQLNTPNLKLRQSTKYLLNNKLSSAYGHILSASNKMGAPDTSGQTPQTRTGPFQKFVNLLTAGQMQLQSAQDYLSNMASDGKSIQPADLLMVQVRLSKAQQELEYSSLLLGKAVDSVKQMMNIQL